MLSAPRNITTRGARLEPEAMVRLGTWMAVILVIVLAWNIAKLTWDLLVIPDSAPIPVSQPMSVLQPMSVPPLEGPGMGRVADLHLFGRAETMTATPEVPAEVPETRLRLTLKGVVASGLPVQGVALIADDRQNERHYRVGAELPGGARLEQIFSDRVILSREGRFEMLRLPREALDSAAVVPVAQSGQSGQSGGTTQAPPLRDAGLAASLATRRDTWLREPDQFMDAIRMRPVQEQGMMKGFAVTPRRDPALFRQAGLRPGDVVTGINGMPVNTITDPQALLAELAQATEIRLDLERQGRPMSLTLPIGQ